MLAGPWKTARVAVRPRPAPTVSELHAPRREAKVVVVTRPYYGYSIWA